MSSPPRNTSNAWIRHFDQMATGAGDSHSSNVYVLKRPAPVKAPAAAINLVEPTQAVVHQAKQEVQRENNIEEDRVRGVKYATPTPRNPPQKRSKSSLIQPSDVFQDI